MDTMYYRFVLFDFYSFIFVDTLTKKVGPKNKNQTFSGQVWVWTQFDKALFSVTSSNNFGLNLNQLTACCYIND